MADGDAPTEVVDMECHEDMHDIQRGDDTSERTSVSTGALHRVLLPELVPLVLEYAAAQHLYAVGGAGPASGRPDAMRTVERFDPDERTWKRLPNMLHAHCNGSATAALGGVYVAGHYQSELPVPQIVIERLDLRRLEWTTCDTGRRLGYATVFLDGHMYTIGRNPDHSNFRADLRRAPPSGPWTWSPIASLPARVMDFGAAVTHCGLLYVIAASCLYCYDPDDDEWQQLPSMPAERWYMSAAVAYDRLYVFGGMRHVAGHAGGQHRRKGGLLQTDFYYSFKERKWHPLLTTLGVLRWGAVATYFQGRIYVLGGFDANGASCYVESYDPMTDTWREEPPMLERRDEFAVAVA
jgi:hypothetical protein